MRCYVAHDPSRVRRSRTTKRLFTLKSATAALLLAVALVLTLSVLFHGGAALASVPATGVINNEQRSSALLDGEADYAFHCAVCHGRSGGGLAEARLAFPPDSRHCTRCHKPNNRVVMPLSQPTVDNDMFSIGQPPALHPLPAAAAGEVEGPPPMASVAAPEALFAYVRATMPRYEPSRLSDSEYWLIAAFLLNMNDRPAATDRAIREAVAAGWSVRDGPAAGER